MKQKPNAHAERSAEMSAGEGAESVLKTQLRDFRERCLTVEWIFAALFSGVLGAYILSMLMNPNFSDLQGYYGSLHFGLFFAAALVIFAALVGVTYASRIKSLIPRTLTLLAFVLSVQFAMNGAETVTVSVNGADKYFDTRVFFLLGVALVDLIVVLWAVRGDKLALSSVRISRKFCFIAAIVLFVITTAVFFIYTSMKYRAYVNATFDFGIFAQMFERMAATGKADTTVERSVLMSHFGVHFSPIYYLFLPGYFLFRSPLYLYFIQAAAVAAGVFAVYLICGKMALSGKMTLAFELIYLFFPCLFNGTFYDFHENKFLTVIILFLFYFILSEKALMTFVFSLLLLGVKEDAAIYLIAISLFVFFYLKKRVKGALLFALAAVYFLIAQQIVASFGVDGVMMWRLSDYFVNGEQGFFSVFKSIFFDFGYLLRQMFTFDKIPFILWMFLPVVFTPFMSKKISALVLLLPMIPINLMQSWRYQYDIDFQYTYGVAALVLMCALFAVTSMRTNPKRAAVLLSLFLCAVMSASLLVPKMRINKSNLDNDGETAAQVDELLEQIPADSSVTASHRIMPHLYYVAEIYTVPDYYAALKETDYYVVDTRDTGYTGDMMTAMGPNYELVGEAGFAQIYRHR